MKLTDVDYFKQKRCTQPSVYLLAHKVYTKSQGDDSDRLELDKKLQALANATESSEHLRQASNVVAEMVTYANLMDQKLEPHWVPEGKKPAPDIRDKNGRPHEVKHINTPREEHEALSKKGTYGGMVDTQYAKGLQQKVRDNIDSAKRKFAEFNKTTNSRDSIEGTLHLFYSQSHDAELAKVMGAKSMQKALSGMVKAAAPKEIVVEISDINSYF